MWYGTATNDFRNFTNLADAKLLDLLVRNSPKWLPVVATVNDGATVTADVGKYKPNPFGLYDMHGNAAEWTSSTDPQGNVICRGGSFYDRPYRATATAFRSYLPYQPVFDVGFRVIVKAR
jgi:formylglycine-generating enzyme required for sulfatase activity